MTGRPDGTLRVTVGGTLVWTMGQPVPPFNVERQRTEGLTNNGGMRDGGEEGDDEKLQLEHGDICGVSTGWMLSSKIIHPCFYIFYPLSCEHEKPSVGDSLPPRVPSSGTLLPPRRASLVGVSFPRGFQSYHPSPSICSPGSIFWPISGFESRTT